MSDDFYDVEFEKCYEKNKHYITILETREMWRRIFDAGRQANTDLLYQDLERFGL